MAGSNGNGRIHLLDHQSPQLTKVQQQAEDEQRMATSIERIAEAKALQVIDYFVSQIPGIVATMIGQILHANGFELKPPPEWAQLRGFAPVVATAPGAGSPETRENTDPVDGAGDSNETERDWDGPTDAEGAE